MLWEEKQQAEELLASSPPKFRLKPRRCRRGAMMVPGANEQKPLHLDSLLRRFFPPLLSVGATGVWRINGEHMGLIESQGISRV